MTQFGCICGHQLSDITDFLPYKAHLIPDEDWDTDQDVDSHDAARTVYECENCGRLWIQAAPKWVSYLPESAVRGILRHKGMATGD